MFVTGFTFSVFRSFETVIYCSTLSFFSLINFPSFRGSRSQVFFKIGTLKNFVIFTGRYLCWWSLFLMKMQPSTVLKSDSNTGVFLWILRNLVAGGCFYPYLLVLCSKTNRAILMLFHKYWSSLTSLRSSYEQSTSAIKWCPWFI